MNICLFISFSELSIIVPLKSYKFLTKFFITITVEVKFAFIQMDFWVDVVMTQKKQYFLAHILESSLLTFVALMLKLSLRGAMPEILTIRLSDLVSLATSIIDFAILSGGNSELSSFVPTWKIT